MVLPHLGPDPDEDVAQTRRRDVGGTFGRPPVALGRLPRVGRVGCVGCRSESARGRSSVGVAMATPTRADQR